MSPSAQPTNAVGVDFLQVYTLLTQYQQSNSSLVIPLNNSTLNSIIDILTMQGIESLASKRWNEMVARLHSVKAEENEADDEVKNWLKSQRGLYLNYEEEHVLDTNVEEGVDTEEATESLPNPITAERFNKLRNAGVAMNKWEARLMELRRYYEENGDCDVPINYPDGLGVWVATQKVAYRFDKATMPQGRIDALDAMGFIWQSQKRKDSWSKYFDELVEYIRQHGTSHVSIYDEKFTQLGSWVKRQRAEYKKYQHKGRAKSQMTKERIDKLESIGFQWRLKPEKVTWEERFEALKEYKATNGHCRPSQNENHELNVWSRYQRLNYQYFMEGKSSRLNQSKVDKLSSIGINEPPTAAQAASEQIGNDQIAVPPILPFIDRSI